MRRAVLAIALVCSAHTALATSYAPPTKHDEPSPDQRFVLEVDPDSGVQTVVAAADRTRPLWSFRHPGGFDGYYLANDGRTVAVVAWEFVKVEDLDQPAIELWNASGRVRVYSVRDLIARPPRIRDVGPIGWFWRRWLSDVAFDGRALVVTTTGLHRYTVDMATGETTAELASSGLLVWLAGLAMLGLAVLLAVSAYRRRTWLAAAAPIGTLLWLWLDLAGIPGLPAEVVDDGQLAMFVITLVAVPVSFVAALRLPRGARALRIALAIAALVVLVGVRVAC